MFQVRQFVPFGLWLRVLVYSPGTNTLGAPESRAAAPGPDGPRTPDSTSIRPVRRARLPDRAPLSAYPALSSGRNAAAGKTQLGR